MKFKKIIAVLTTIGSLLIAQNSLATCSNYTNYSDGQVLTAGSLNSLQTNYTGCVNNVLNGDVFTGTMDWHSGTDIRMYSDTGTTQTFYVEGAGGNIETLNAIKDALPSGITSNCGLALAAGVLSLTDESGDALSATNPCCIGVPSITVGENVTLCFTAAQTMNDDSHASSHLTDLGFSITETADWGEDMPYFVYVVNEDDTDANAGIFISRRPSLYQTPGGVFIHDKDAEAGNDDDSSIFGMWSDDAGKANKPCVLIGTIEMQWSTTTDDWTVQVLTGYVGIGVDRIIKSLGVWWKMVVGQNGNAAGKYFADNGGTAPAFDTNIYYYKWNINGSVLINANFTFATVAGVGAVNCVSRLPIGANLSRPMGDGIWYDNNTSTYYGLINITAYSWLLIDGSTILQNDDIAIDDFLFFQMTYF